MSEDTQKVLLCEKFLKTIGSMHNNKARPDDKITKFEIQQLQWNFLENTSDAKHGEVIKRYIFSIQD